VGSPGAYNQGSFSLNEIDERAFLALQHTSIPYHSVGRGSFKLLRGETVVGSVQLDDIGNWHPRAVLLPGAFHYLEFARACPEFCV